jgi:hypothetical protein
MVMISVKKRSQDISQLSSDAAKEIEMLIEPPFMRTIVLYIHLFYSIVRLYYNKKIKFVKI